MHSIEHGNLAQPANQSSAASVLRGQVLSMLMRDLNRMVRTATAAPARPTPDLIGLELTPAAMDAERADAWNGMQEQPQAWTNPYDDVALTPAGDDADVGLEADPQIEPGEPSEHHFRAYLTAVRQRARLDLAAEQHQFQQLQDPCAEVRMQAQNTLLQANLWVVPIVVRRFYRHGSGFEDLVAEGNLGLYKALQRFDVSRGLRFSTYAKWWVTHAVTSAMAANAYPVKVPRRVAQQLARQRRDFGAPYADGDVAVTVVPAAPERLIAAPEAEEYHAESDLRIEEAGDQQPDVQLALRQGLALLTEAIQALPERQRRVIEARYGLNGSPEMTLQAVGDMLGISAEGVRKVQLTATAALKRKLLKGWS